MKPRHHIIALASLAVLAPAMAQDGSQRVEVTGTLIKRTDRETPSVVQTITREEISTSGFATVEELLRSIGAVDTGSIGDGASSGFVNGLSTISLRGFGSQGTLVLINGRRIAPVAAVDINFGRGSLISVNTIPRGAIERIDVLKDGASAMYGSDAMAGVVNYILRKDYVGAEGFGSYSVNDQGVGGVASGGVSFGVGNIGTQRFNIFGGIEVTKRDSVMYSDLKDRGNQAEYNRWLTQLNSSLARFTPDSSASLYASYYRVPTSLAGSTTIDGRTVGNNNLQGANYLGTLPGCPDERTVGKGVPNRPDGFLSTTASIRTGYCRFNLDEADEAISKQERINGVLRANLALSPSMTAYADLMLSRTKTSERLAPYALTTALVTSGNPVATTYITGGGNIVTANAIILPVTHPDNPTRGSATPQPVQLIYRFEDIPQIDTNTLSTTRLTAGIEGSWGKWDFDTAVLYSRQENERDWRGRVRKSLLQSSIASGTYRFGQINTPEAIASVSTPARLSGESTITSLDLRASRPVFKLPGGDAQLAVGVELRRETLKATPDENYLAGDFIGVVANGASGSRNTQALFAELGLPVFKQLELQAAARVEEYSDFGNATTGKLGFKWTPVQSVLALRGTAATGFRAPSIPQIGSSFSGSFHNFQERRVFDNLRCNLTTNTSRADPPVNRDCNVLGFTAVPAGTTNPGSIASVISANPNLKPETSRSMTLGFVLNPSKDIDLAVDAWYFQRRNEIRVKRGVDIMDEVNADPVANAGLVLRDPNPATWLPGIPNSGPILVLFRQYGNYNWSKTSGLDWDLNVRLPATSIGKFSVNFQGTYTARFDQQILAGGTIQRIVGRSDTDIPKGRGSLTLRWRTDQWSSWLRRNYADQVATSNTDACTAGIAAGNTAAANQYLRDNGSCKAGGDRTFDLGVTYSGIRNLTMSATILNVANDYSRASGVPSAFTYWDPGLAASLGRRIAFSANYKFQ